MQYVTAGRKDRGQHQVPHQQFESNESSQKGVFLCIEFTFSLFNLGGRNERVDEGTGRQVHCMAFSM
jgi:hypothetical protein